jgi:hypothetical protein
MKGRKEMEQYSKKQRKQSSKAKKDNVLNKKDESQKMMEIR